MTENEAELRLLTAKVKILEEIAFAKRMVDNQIEYQAVKVFDTSIVNGKWEGTQDEGTVKVSKKEWDLIYDFVHALRSIGAWKISDTANKYLKEIEIKEEFLKLLK